MSTREDAKKRAIFLKRLREAAQRNCNQSADIA